MKTFALAWHYLWSRPLAAVLNGVTLSLGLASITFLLLVGHQIHKAFERDLVGIDAVVGAKGSPMQLILAGVLHMDVPPGNIKWQDAQALQANPMVEKVIPLSLGDNLQGFRIVGTSHSYAQLYGASLAQGRMWDAPMQAVLGAHVARTLGLAVGQTFAGSHGISGGGPAHGAVPYRVVGVLAPSGSVLDRLVLTDMASVWDVHAAHDKPTAPAAADDHEAHDEHSDHADHDSDKPGAHPTKQTPAHTPAVDAREITMALVVYKTPLAAMSFPRMVNTGTAMQAASPAVEISRLLHMLGLGTDVLRAFAAVLLLTAGLSVFMALWSAVRERQADLALLRMLGAPPARVAALLLCEAFWLGVVATVGGLVLGQCFVAFLAWGLQLDQAWLAGGMAWPAVLWLVPAMALLVVVGAALLPAWSAYRVGVLQLLHKR